MTSTNEIATLDKERCEILKADTRGRIRIPRKKREEILVEYDKSGMSGAAFSKWLGIKYTTFSGWLQKRERGCSGWVEAVVTDSMEASEAINIHLGKSVRVESRSVKKVAELLRVKRVGPHNIIIE